jgi:hypothetical protein
MTQKWQLVRFGFILMVGKTYREQRILRRPTAIKRDQGIRAFGSALTGDGESQHRTGHGAY